MTGEGGDGTVGGEALSSDDARILAMESSAIMGHTLKLLILEPGEPLDLAVLQQAVLARLDSQPRARERVELGSSTSAGGTHDDGRATGEVATDGAANDGPAKDGAAYDGTAGGGGPRWVPAEEFDITQHVRRRAGAECATRDDLRRVVSTLMSEHLDRRRPLWTLDLIGPLADGTEAIAARLHHAMVDGIAGIRFLEGILLDPHDAPVHSAGVRDAPSGPAGHAGDASAAHDEWMRMPSAVLRELGHPGTRSPFDKPITSAREVAFTIAPLDELKRIGASRASAPQHAAAGQIASHATVNDVLLAIVAGGLRSWLPRHGRGEHLKAQVPVSLHHRGEGATQLGNRDSFINVDLPLHESDPVRALDQISAQTRTEKQLDDAALLYDLMHALGTSGPAGELVHYLAGSSREFSVAVSNVPGPRVEVSVARRRVSQLFTSSEPASHHALRIAAISNATQVGIGFCTDPTALADVSGLADAVTESYERLHAAALGSPA